MSLPEQTTGILFIPASSWGGGRDMKLLVTGGAGYIGSVMTAQLLEAGHQATVFDNLSKGHLQAVPAGADFIEGNLLNEEQLKQVLTQGFEGVLHFAALSLVGDRKSVV